LLFRLPSTNKSRALPLLAWVSISKASCRIRFACWSLETLLCLHDCVDRSNCYRFVSSSYQEKQSPSVALFFSFFSSCTCVADRRGPTRRHALPLTTHLPRPHTVVQREKERGREFVCWSNTVTIMQLNLISLFGIYLWNRDDESIIQARLILPTY
jgi:hypothetical protein